MSMLQALRTASLPRECPIIATCLNLNLLDKSKSANICGLRFKSIILCKARRQMLANILQEYESNVEKNEYWYLDELFRFEQDLFRQLSSTSNRKCHSSSSSSTHKAVHVYSWAIIVTSGNSDLLFGDQNKREMDVINEAMTAYLHHQHGSPARSKYSSMNGVLLHYLVSNGIVFARISNESIRSIVKWATITSTRALSSTLEILPSRLQTRPCSRHVHIDTIESVSNYNDEYDRLIVGEAMGSTFILALSNELHEW